MSAVLEPPNIERELGLARGAFGLPLLEQQRQLLRDLIAAPSYKLWDAARYMVLNPEYRPMTLWSCVMEIDPHCLQSPTGSYKDFTPSQGLLFAALRLGTH